MSEVKNEIQAFLEKEFDNEESQFSEGLVLFIKYSRNRNLQNFITRRGIREHTRLMLNLKQLTKLGTIQASKVVGNRVSANVTKPIVAGVVDTAALPTMAGPGHINPSQLSPEMLVEFNNGKLFAKTAQQYHLKMKDESLKGEERADFRKQMIEQTDKSKICFGKCSDFIATLNAEGNRLSQSPKTETLSAKEISAIRKYVSEKLKKWEGYKGGAKTKVLAALNTRIAKMQNAGENFAPETVTKLKNIGVYFGE